MAIPGALLQLEERREGGPSSQAAIGLRFIILAASVSRVAITKNSRHDLRARVVPDPWQTEAVLFKERFWAGLRSGSLTVAYRRWKRPSVKTGGTLVSPGGLLGIDSVEAIDGTRVDDAAAREAGYASREELFANLRGDGQLYRIRFHRIGEDPRLELRERAELTASESKAIARTMQHNDWALPYLRLIDELPGTVSTELAARAGVERPVFKQRVRRLKALGLTESLEVGYRISRRGRTVLADHAIADAT